MSETPSDFRNLAAEQVKLDAQNVERRLAWAILDGEKAHYEPYLSGGEIRYDLSTHWWQVRKRRTMRQLARKALGL